MNRSLVERLVFCGAVGTAALVYWLSAMEGLPWSPSGHEVATGEMGYWLRFFAGSPVLLSGFCATFTAGLLAVFVTRLLGWRFGSAAAVLFIFLPGIWNRAVTGDPVLGLVFAAFLVLWVLWGMAVWALRKVFSAQAQSPQVFFESSNSRFARWKRYGGYGAMGLAAFYAIIAAMLHDYEIGEGPSVYARGVVEEAAGRLIVCGGAFEDQLAYAARQGRRVLSTGGGVEGGGGPAESPVLRLRTDPEYLAAFSAWARDTYPAETNLHVLAQIGVVPFLNEARKSHPEDFYFTNGDSTTPEGWNRRLDAIKPYFASSDKSAKVLRRIFAVQGNALANRFQDEGRLDEAWALYVRIDTEVEKDNYASLFNRSEMIRSGYAVDLRSRREVDAKLLDFFKDERRAANMREIVLASGRVRIAPEKLAKMRERAREIYEARKAELLAAGEKLEMPPALKTLVERNNEMVEAMAKGDHEKAAAIARQILAHEEWRGFIPANAVLGTILSRQGDLVAAERFFRVAAIGEGRVPPAVCDAFADTLLKLGKTEEAEQWARKAVEQTPDRYWKARLTLAEVLAVQHGSRGTSSPAEGNGGGRAVSRDPQAEAIELLETARKYAPPEVSPRLQKRLEELGIR